MVQTNLSYSEEGCNKLPNKSFESISCNVCVATAANMKPPTIECKGSWYVYLWGQCLANSMCFTEYVQLVITAALSWLCAAVCFHCVLPLFISSEVITLDWVLLAMSHLPYWELAVHSLYWHVGLTAVCLTPSSGLPKRDTKSKYFPISMIRSDRWIKVPSVCNVSRENRAFVSFKMM